MSVRSKVITDSMKEAAARAIAEVIKDDEISADYLLPDPFNPNVVEVVAKAVADEAIRLGERRI